MILTNPQCKLLHISCKLLARSQVAGVSGDAEFLETAELRGSPSRFSQLLSAKKAAASPAGLLPRWDWTADITPSMSCRSKLVLDRGGPSS